MRYAWFALACVSALFLAFHLTFRVTHRCVAHQDGRTYVVADGYSSGFGKVSCGRIIRFR